MRIIYTLLFSLFFFCLYSQDSYHQQLVSQLSSEYDLTVNSFIFNNTEQQNVSEAFVYGNTDYSTETITDFDFTIKAKFNVRSGSENPWDSGYGIRNNVAVAQGDILLFVFWAKRTSEKSEFLLYAEDADTYEKAFYSTISFTPDWNQYFIALEAPQNYAIDKLTVGFHLATMAQSFETGGFTGLNLGKINIDDVPSTFGPNNYEGSEQNAEWRIAAEDRIEQIRKANLNITVKDASENIIPGAKVEIEMQEHSFGFGTAFVGCRIPGNRCYNEMYVNKILDLDGEGHRFNVGVMENALKWDGWEEQWIGTPDQTMDAVEFLSDAGVKMRGHTLFWPGYSNMPDDIASNSTDLNYLRARIDTRINEMIDNERLGPLLREWDILNEITQNTDLAQAFSSDPNFESGREIYQEIIQKVRAVDPDVKLYINDYVTLSGGGSGAEVVNRYKSYLDEIHETVGMDGIGFQAHIGSPPTSIIKAEETFNEFYERYGTRMSVTEYDISPNISDEVQAQYLGDFLTLVFSYPAMDAFIMWGFWDGNHWKDNAPLFDVDWNLKPSGEVFFNKVFNEWWTSEEGETNDNGKITFRPFKGTHRVIITHEGVQDTINVNLENDKSIEVIFGVSTGLTDPELKTLKVVPNILEKGSQFSISGPGGTEYDLEIIDAQGRLIQKYRAFQTGQDFYAPTIPGMYFVKIKGKGINEMRRLVVE